MSAINNYKKLIHYANLIYVYLNKMKSKRFRLMTRHSKSAFNFRILTRFDFPIDFYAHLHFRPHFLMRTLRAICCRWQLWEKEKGRTCSCFSILSSRFSISVCSCCAVSVAASRPGCQRQMQLQLLTFPLSWRPEKI